MPVSKLNDFDPEDEVSYYYGNLNRDHVKEVLNEASIGTFLIRDSTKDFDQKVLCVKEAPGVINSYKIIPTTIPSDQTDSSISATTSFHIHGKKDFNFPSIPAILQFYATHYLNQSQLIRPAFWHKQVRAVLDFCESSDPVEDLYFKKNDILKVLEYTQGEHWWNAEIDGRTGLIPATYVRRLKPDEVVEEVQKDECSTQKVDNLVKSIENTVQKVEVRLEEEKDDSKDDDIMKCPFMAKVVEDYTPSPYEKSHVALKKGQLVTVLDMQSIGKWYGQVHAPDGKVEFDKKGLFPFNRVEPLKSNLK